MSVIAVAGLEFRVKIATFDATTGVAGTPVDYSCQIRSGTISDAPQGELIKVLCGDKVRTLSDSNDTIDFDFLYDAATGLYEALWTAARNGTALDVEIVGGKAQWSGKMWVTNLSVPFDAEGTVTASVSMEGSWTNFVAIP